MIKKYNNFYKYLTIFYKITNLLIFYYQNLLPFVEFGKTFLKIGFTFLVKLEFKSVVLLFKILFKFLLIT